MVCSWCRQRGEWCDCIRQVRWRRGWLENSREDDTDCILRDSEVRRGGFTAKTYCPLKSPAAPKAPLASFMNYSYTLSPSSAHYSWLLRCEEFATEPKLENLINQNSVKISPLQLAVFNTTKLTMDIEKRVLNQIIQISVCPVGHGDFARDLEMK